MGDRPRVGNDTQLPDYVSLISTVGGLAVTGLNGFVVGPLIAAMFVSAWPLGGADRRSAEAEGVLAVGRRPSAAGVSERSYPVRVGSPSRRCAGRLSRPGRSSPSLVDAMEDASERIRELEARLVAHGLVLKAIARLLSEATIAELKAAAQGIDDEGMQEANPNLHMRRVAEEIWSILEMVG